MLCRPLSPLRSLTGTGMFVLAFVTGCNGGSTTVPRSGGAATATPTPTPSSAPLPASATASIPVGTSAGSAMLGPVLGGYSSAITVPAASSTAALTVTLSAGQPAGTPAVQTVKRRAQTIGAATAPVAFVTVTSNATVTLGASPSFSFTLPAGSASLGQISYVALYDPSASPQTGWSVIEGPGTVSGTTISFTGSNAALRLTTGVTYDLVLFTVGTALPTPSPVPTAPPTPAPTLPPTHGTVVEYPLPTNVIADKIAAGPDGNLWFNTGDGIGKITTSGTVTLYTISVTAGTAGIAAGPDGNLWFTESTTGKVGKISTSGTITEYAVPLPAQPSLGAIAAGPDGNLWFTVNDGNPMGGALQERIAKITPAGSVTEYVTPFVSVGLGWITAGPDGNLWYTLSDGYIGKITTSGTITQYGIPEQPGPGQITPGPGGNLWFSAGGGEGVDSYGDVAFITTSGKVTQFVFPQHYYGPGIAAGPDGNLWLGERVGTNVAKVTPAGALTEYAVPSKFNPQYVTAGPDGNMWYTTLGGSGPLPQSTILKVTP